MTDLEGREAAQNDVGPLESDPEMAKRTQVLRLQNMVRGRPDGTRERFATAAAAGPASLRNGPWRQCLALRY